MGDCRQMCDIEVPAAPITAGELASSSNTNHENGDTNNNNTCSSIGIGDFGETEVKTANANNNTDCCTQTHEVGPVGDCSQKLEAVSNSAESTSEIVRVWCDGCYDMVHFGHANSLRQAKALGNHLIVGIHSDEEITKHKGAPPVFTMEERRTMVEGIKWVDEVICPVPYVTTIETLAEYNCDFCAHGDDITCTADGHDTYQEVKDAKRYKEVKRTQGISTTDLVKRMLELESESSSTNACKKSSPYTGNGTGFLCTTWKLMQFRNPDPIPDGAKVAYVAGAFDILHPGHLHFLKKASEYAKEHGLADYLIVGLHDEPTIQSYQGKKPIMNLVERSMSVLACKFVDDIVMGAPYVITEELLDHLNVSVVLHGQTPIVLCPSTEKDPHQVPMKRDIFKTIDSGSTLTTDQVIQRIVARRPEYEERNRRKEEKECALLAAAAAARGEIP